MSLARNRKALAISSGWPTLPRGIVFDIFSTISCGRFATMSVAVTPGATALTRILYFPNSLASDFVIPLTAYLLAGYPTPLGCPYCPTMELVLMMDPPFLLYMCLAASLEHRKTAFTFRSMIFLKFSGSYSIKLSLDEIPALLARMSMLPNVSSILLKVCWTACASVIGSDSPMYLFVLFGYNCFNCSNAFSTV